MPGLCLRAMRVIVQFFRDLRDAGSRWYADDGPLMSAATAYYVGLSFFPLLLVLIAGVGLFLQTTHLGQDAKQEVLTAINHNMSEQLASYVTDALQSVQEKSIISGPLGLLTMLVTSLAAFAQFDSAFDRIWRIPSRNGKSIVSMALALLIQRGRAFLLLFGLGTFVILVFLAGMVLAAIQSRAADILPQTEWLWNGVQIGITLAMNTLVFMLLLRLLPKAPVRWCDAFHGALLTAVAWEIGRQVLAIFIARGKYTSAYGVVGAFLAILLWCYYAVTIILLGAEYIHVIRARKRKSRAARR
jgi:membrane protein